VRYYVSLKAIKHGYQNCAVKTVNAKHMDDLVRALVVDYLASISLDRLAREPLEVRDHWIRAILDVVVLTTERLAIQLDTVKIAACREEERDGTPTPELTPVPTCPFKPEIERRGRHVVIVLSIRIKRLDGRRILVPPEGRQVRTDGRTGTIRTPARTGARVAGAR